MNKLTEYDDDIQLHQKGFATFRENDVEDRGVRKGERRRKNNEPVR